MNCTRCISYNHKVEAAYELRNGEEVEHLCSSCFMEAVFDFVTENNHVEFNEVRGHGGMAAYQLGPVEHRLERKRLTEAMA